MDVGKTILRANIGKVGAIQFCVFYQELLKVINDYTGLWSNVIKKNMSWEKIISVKNC